jgi:huntingtin interacting protein 1
MIHITKKIKNHMLLIQKGTSSVKEFYAKNHKWTEGLVSAAKLVGLGANVLM